jgi:hypothetical protein
LTPLSCTLAAVDYLCRDATVRVLIAVADCLADNPNQWGDPQDTGALCMSVSLFLVFLKSRGSGEWQ